MTFNYSIRVTVSPMPHVRGVRFYAPCDEHGALPVEAPTVWGFETCDDACRAAEAYLDDARFDHDAPAARNGGAK